MQLQQTLSNLTLFHGNIAGKFLSFNIDASECNHEILPILSKICLEFQKNIRLICELTEKEHWCFDVKQRCFLERLIRSGCELALDDFGTGYSHPGMVTESGARYMKIAGSIIRQITCGPLSHAYTEGLILIARKAGMQVIAEGVETHYQRIWLVKRGVTLFQGFYFSPPLLPEDFWSHELTEKTKY